MKGALVCILSLMLCLSVESALAETVNANIDSYDFPSGIWHRGDDQDGNNVWIKNTGDVSHQFWVSFSAMDSSGEWYIAPPQSVLADPDDDSTWFIGCRWHIPSDAMQGSYQARYTLYSDYDQSTGQLYNQLDQVDKANAFVVV